MVKDVKYFCGFESEIPVCFNNLTYNMHIVEEITNDRFFWMRGHVSFVFL